MYARFVYVLALMQIQDLTLLADGRRIRVKKIVPGPLFSE